MTGRVLVDPFWPWNLRASQMEDVAHRWISIVDHKAVQVRYFDLVEQSIEDHKAAEESSLRFHPVVDGFWNRPSFLGLRRRYPEPSTPAQRHCLVYGDRSLSLSWSCSQYAPSDYPEPYHGSSVRLCCISA